MKLILVFTIIFSSNAFGNELLWLAAGGSHSSFSNVKPEAAKKLSSGTSYFFDFDFAHRMPLMAAHYGYRSTTASDVKMNLNGQPLQPTDFKIYNHEAGIKLILPLPYFDIYFGGGFLWGKSTVATEERAAYGRYWHGGLNYYFNRFVGLKLAYQKNTLQTSNYKNLNNERMKFDQGIISLAVVLRFGGFANDLFK